MNPRLLPSATVARSVLRTQTDVRLTDLARAGSEPAFEAIVARYRRSLVRYCARLVGEGDAEEAVQEALLKAHAALLGGDPVHRLAPWLHVVAHNTAVSYLRARSSRPQPADADYDSCAAVDSSAEYRQELGEVLAAVQGLPARQRDAIVMRELEGRSYEEIAARLGSSHGAVRQLLHRARSSVRGRVAALLPLEPLARWALSGAGGADAAGGASVSSACLLGAKACAALILPATVAIVATAPSSRPKTTKRRDMRPATASIAYPRTPAAAARATVAVAVTDVSVSASRPAASPVAGASRLPTAAARRGTATGPAATTAPGRSQVQSQGQGQSHGQGAGQPQGQRTGSSPAPAGRSASGKATAPAAAPASGQQSSPTASAAVAPTSPQPATSTTGSAPARGAGQESSSASATPSGTQPTQPSRPAQPTTSSTASNLWRMATTRSP